MERQWIVLPNMLEEVMTGEWISVSEWLRCLKCGRYISGEQIAEHRFTPDTHFTAEKNEYVGECCIEPPEDKPKR
jgi:hypothetical protein